MLCFSIFLPSNHETFLAKFSKAIFNTASMRVQNWLNPCQWKIILASKCSRHKGICYFHFGNAVRNGASKGSFICYVIKKVGGWVWPNAYVCLQGGWVGLAKCLRNHKNQWKMDFQKNTNLTSSLQFSSFKYIDTNSLMTNSTLFSIRKTATSIFFIKMEGK